MAPGTEAGPLCGAPFPLGGPHEPPPRRVASPCHLTPDRRGSRIRRADHRRPAAARGRPTRPPASASRVRGPRAGSRAVPDLARPGPSRGALRGLTTPPRAVACPRPAARPPAWSPGRRRLTTRRALIRRVPRLLPTAWSSVSTSASRSASPTDPPPPRGAVPRLTAWAARRVGRQPAEEAWTVAAKRGSSPSLPACGTTRSRPVGPPRGRCRPSGWGLSPRRPGGGLSLPPCRASARPCRQAATPWRSPSSRPRPSRPALPPWARPACQARPRISDRSRRSSRAWTRRGRLLLAARDRLRWRGRACSGRWRWPGWACPVPARPAGRGCSRGPSRRSRAVVSSLHGRLASAAFSPDVPLAVARRLLPVVPAAVGR
jgi:hypothetical protein